jgi:hypothetical protein
MNTLQKNADYTCDFLAKIPGLQVRPAYLFYNYNYNSTQLQLQCCLPILQQCLLTYYANYLYPPTYHLPAYQVVVPQGAHTNTLSPLPTRWLYRRAPCT